MDYAEKYLRLHFEWHGKLEVMPRAAVDSREAIALAYTPGVARPCLEVQRDPDKSYALTRRWNTAAVARVTILLRRPGTLAQTLQDADMLIGVSGPGTVTADMVHTMRRASGINDPMKLAAARALAALAPMSRLDAEHIIPEAFDPRVVPAVAGAVRKAHASGVAQI